MKRPSLSLFQRTGLTLGAGLILFSGFALFVVRLMVLQPVVERAAEELAALLELSAKAWVELPPWTRGDYEQELRERHGLRVVTVDAELTPLDSPPPYLEYLQTALDKRFDATPVILLDPETPGWYWLDLRIGRHTLRLGFEQTRLRQRIPTAVLLIGTGGALFILGATLLVARRVTAPLSRLHDAVRYLGTGGTSFEMLPETGVRELAALARRINRTEQEVRELLANRTTLLAGVSHDLRTPIARMQLELTLLEGQADADLLNGLRKDLDEMNSLITRALELARGLDRQEAAVIDLPELVRSLTDDYRRGGARLTCDTPQECDIEVPPAVFRRVMGNLLDNAVRYGAGQPIEVAVVCRPDGAAITIRDHGPGIPAAQRAAVMRPFHRLEGSRNPATGGSGLGLAIVKQLCSAHDWHLALSEAEGGGLAAEVGIPRYRA